MSSYRRIYIDGGYYFFTVVTYQRQPIFSTKQNIDLLHESFTYTQTKKPFKLNAIVILPDHIHCIWSMPENDSDFSTRWQMIKTVFSRKWHNKNNSDKQVWQPRFWEHLIRDEEDFKNHLDYIHYNPVKHGYVTKPEEWRDSTLRKFIQKGWYDESWGQSIPENLKEMDLE